MPEVPGIDVEEELKDLERVVAAFPDPRMAVVYDYLRRMPDGEGMDLPPFLTGRPRRGKDLEALEPDERAAHQVAAFLRAGLAGESTSRRRLLVLRELIELRRAHFLHQAPTFDRFAAYGVEPELIAALDGDRFSNLLMLIAVGRM